MLKFVMTLFVAIFSIAVAAASEKPLTEDQAKRFVETLPSLDALGEELRAEGKMDDLQIDTQPKAGEKFEPYSAAVTALEKKSPSDLNRLEKVVKNHGFTAKEWGSVGDRVMVAWMATRMAEEDPRSVAMMEGMDASMLEMMPAEMRAQLEGAFAMMETVKNAPEADKAAIAPVKDDLEAYMEQADKN